MVLHVCDFCEQKLFWRSDFSVQVLKSALRTFKGHFWCKCAWTFDPFPISLQEGAGSQVGRFQGVACAPGGLAGTRRWRTPEVQPLWVWCCLRTEFVSALLRALASGAGTPSWGTPPGGAASVLRDCDQGLRWRPRCKAVGADSVFFTVECAYSSGLDGWGVWTLKNLWWEITGLTRCGT